MSEVELFDIFNEEMLKIGTDSRTNVHAKGLWHQTFHCWIINKTTSGKRRFQEIYVALITVVLYNQLGYREAYTYWYRHKKFQNDGQI